MKQKQTFAYRSAAISDRKTGITTNTPPSDQELIMK